MHLIYCDKNDYWAPDCCDSGYTFERWKGRKSCAINVNESCVSHVGDTVMPGTECVHAGVGDKWYQCIKVKT